MNAITSGEITNLLANDANRIEVLLCFFNYLWVRLINIFFEGSDQIVYPK
jgi:hypothetical protein